MIKYTFPRKLDSFWRLALVVMALRTLSSETSFLAYLIVLIYGLRSPRHTIEALVLSWFITMANENIFGSVAGGTIGRFTVLFGVAAAAFSSSAVRFNHVNIITTLLGCYMIFHSLLFSPVMTVSVLKGLTWLLAMVSITLSFGRLSRDEFHLLENHIYGFLVLVVFLCIPTYLLFPGGQMTGYGYLRGVLGHSQATGALGALVAIWAFGRMLDKKDKAATDFLVFSMGFATAFLSGTRTALIAILVAIVAVLIVSALHNNHRWQNLWRKMGTPVVVVCTVAVLFGAVVNGESVLSRFSEFLDKGSGAVDLAAAYETSRGALIDRMLENIYKDPIVGIGFGIASYPETMEIERVAGIPVSAVVEKGVAHIAIWEELGIIGLILYIFWVVVVFFRGFRAEARQFGLLTVIFLLNFGDAYIFSAGGMGLLLMVLIGFASYRYLRHPISRRRSSSASVPPGGVAQR